MSLRTIPTLLILAAALPAVEPTLADLDQEIRILKRKAEIAAEEAAAKAKTSASAFANDKDGIGIRANDGSWRLKFGGLLAADARIYAGDDQRLLTDTALVRYFRPSITLSVGEWLDAVFVPEFAGTVGIVDGYLEAKASKAFAVRAGKFATPIGLERWQSTPALAFPERSLASNLTPNRDVGIQVGGEVLDGKLLYAVGVFNGVPDNGNRDQETAGYDGDGKDAIARIALRPFAGSGGFGEGLTVALAASYGHENDSLAGNSLNHPTYRSSGQQAIFTYTTNAGSDAVRSDGDRVRINPQASFYQGPFSLLGEYVTSRQELRTDDGDQTIAHDGWFVGAGWVLTGEKAGWRGVTPAAPFSIGGPGWGALEAVARVSVLDIDDEVFAADTTAPGTAPLANATTQVSKATAYGLGLNWWLTKQVRLTGAFERTVFEGGGGGTAADPEDRESENLITSRFQIAF
ncbi:MAG: hypothetical protein RLZZ127_1488 [Planctomycetota bacterium]|jgi:phosphate-selective porin OprO/OprP